MKKKDLNVNEIELFPIAAQHQKSFNGKAFVRISFDGSETLYSYDTPIVKRDPSGKLSRIWGGWSATTGKHIRAFCGLNKAGFDALEMC